MHLESSRSSMISLSLHVAVLFTLLLLPSLSLTPIPVQDLPAAIPLVPRKLTWRRQEAGGGQQQQTPATQGRLQVSLAPRPMVPPATKPLDRTPQLIAEAAISFELAQPRVAVLGDPLSSVTGPASGGPGKQGGLGDGTGPGVGQKGGAGLQSAAERWRGVVPPVVIYRVEPEYPDEARKAKFQGSVMVTVEVDEEGHVRDLRITKPAGLGLDQRALEAVRQWRFRPATRDGRPVAVPAHIEVSFHLL